MQSGFLVLWGKRSDEEKIKPWKPLSKFIEVHYYSDYSDFQDTKIITHFLQTICEKFPKILLPNDTMATIEGTAYL